MTFRSLSMPTGFAFTVMLSSRLWAQDAVPAGLESFRAQCKAPAAKLVIVDDSLSPHYASGGREGGDPDWPFAKANVEMKIDEILFFIGGACDPNDMRGIDWKVADKIIASKSGNGTRFERPERPVPVERFAGVTEIRVVFDERYLVRKNFVDKGGDHRDWLKKELGNRVDPKLLEEDMRNIMAVNGMPPMLKLEKGILTVGLAPPTQIDSGLEKLFVRAVDIALGGAAKKK